MTAVRQLYDFTTLEVSRLWMEQTVAKLYPQGFRGEFINGRFVIPAPRDSAVTPRIGSEQK